MVGTILYQQTKSTIQMVYMNNKKLDTLMKDFSPIKTLVFFLIFSIMCMIVIFAFLVPNIKEYKSVKIEYTRHLKSLNKSIQIQNQKEDELQNITKNNMKILDALIKKFNKTNFLNYTNRFFSDVKLSKKINLNEQDKFVIYELNVTTSLKSPNNFYDFLDGLSTYENIIKADFPIKLIAQKDKIKSSFKIKVYNAK